MPSPLLTATFQAAALSFASNLFAQTLQSYNSSTALNLSTLLNFTLFSLISTPPNFFWQQLLESWFPSMVPSTPRPDPAATSAAAGAEMRLSKRNTLYKFVTDQIFGGPVNTLLFLAAMGYLGGREGEELWQYVAAEFWPLMKAGAKVWPLVSLLAFSVVPADKRVAFGSVVGFAWNVYLSLARM